MSIYAHNFVENVTIFKDSDAIVESVFPVTICDAIPIERHSTKSRLGPTFNKLNVFRLEGLHLFIDLDTVCVGNLQPLYDSGHFSICRSVAGSSASPMLNTGVFVYEGSEQLFDAIVQHGSDFGTTRFGEQDIVSDFFLRQGCLKEMPMQYNFTTCHNRMKSDGTLQNNDYLMGAECVR
jgi:hypothetical protein